MRRWKSIRPHVSKRLVSEGDDADNDDEVVKSTAVAPSGRSPSVSGQPDDFGGYAALGFGKKTAHARGISPHLQPKSGRSGVGFSPKRTWDNSSPGRGSVDSSHSSTRKDSAAASPTSNRSAQTRGRNTQHTSKNTQRTQKTSAAVGWESGAGDAWDVVDDDWNTPVGDQGDDGFEPIAVAPTSIKNVRCARKPTTDDTSGTDSSTGIFATSRKGPRTKVDRAKVRGKRAERSDGVSDAIFGNGSGEGVQDDIAGATKADTVKAKEKRAQRSTDVSDTPANASDDIIDNEAGQDVHSDAARATKTAKAKTRDKRAARSAAVGSTQAQHASIDDGAGEEVLGAAVGQTTGDVKAETVDYSVENDVVQAPVGESAQGKSEHVRKAKGEKGARKKHTPKGKVDAEGQAVQLTDTASKGKSGSEAFADTTETRDAAEGDTSGATDKSIAEDVKVGVSHGLECAADENAAIGERAATEGNSIVDEESAVHNQGWADSANTDDGWGQTDTWDEMEGTGAPGVGGEKAEVTPEGVMCDASLDDTLHYTGGDESVVETEGMGRDDQGQEMAQEQDLEQRYDQNQEQGMRDGVEVEAQDNTVENARARAQTTAAESTPADAVTRDVAENVTANEHSEKLSNETNTDTINTAVERAVESLTDKEVATEDAWDNGMEGWEQAGEHHEATDTARTGEEAELTESIAADDGWAQDDSAWDTAESFEPIQEVSETVEQDTWTGGDIAPLSELPTVVDAVEREEQSAVLHGEVDAGDVGVAAESGGVNEGVADPQADMVEVDSLAVEGSEGIAGTHGDDATGHEHEEHHEGVPGDGDAFGQSESEPVDGVEVSDGLDAVDAQQMEAVHDTGQYPEGEQRVGKDEEYETCNEQNTSSQNGESLEGVHLESQIEATGELGETVGAEKHVAGQEGHAQVEAEAEYEEAEPVEYTDELVGERSHQDFEDKGQHVEGHGEYEEGQELYAAESAKNVDGQEEYCQEQGELTEEQGAYAVEGHGDYADAYDERGGGEGEYAEKHGEHAEEQGEYAEEQGEYVDEHGEHAGEQGEYAEEQGEYAEEQGGYAEAQGEYAEEQGEYAEEQGEYAEVQAEDIAEVGAQVDGVESVHFADNATHVQYAEDACTEYTDESYHEYVDEQGQRSHVDSESVGYDEGPTASLEVHAVNSVVSSGGDATDPREQQVLHLSMEVSELQDQNQQLEDTNAQLMAKINELSGTIYELRESNNSLQTEYNKAEKARKQAAKSARGTAELEALMAEKDEEIEGLLGEGTKLSQQMHVKDTAIKKLREKNKELETHLGKSQKSMDEKDAYLAKTTLEKNSATEQLAASVARASQLEKEMGPLKHELHTAKQNLESSERIIQNLNDKVEAFRIEVDNVRREGEDRVRTIEEKVMTEQMGVSEDVTARYEKQIETGKEAIELLRAQIETLESAHSAKEDEWEDVHRRTVMEAEELREQLQEQESRVEDLTNELVVSAAPLNKQIESLRASLAEHQEELHMVERSYTERLGEADAKLSEAIQNEDNYARRMDEASENVAHLTSVLTDEREQHELKLNKAVAKQRELQSELDLEKERANAEITRLENEKLKQVSLSEHRMEESLSRVEELEKQNSACTAQIGELKTELAQMEEELRHYAHRGSPTTSPMERAQSLRREISADGSHLSSSSIKVHSTGDELGRLNTDTLSNWEQLKGALHQREREVVSLQRQIQEETNLRVSMEEEVTALVAEIEELQVFKGKVDELQTAYEAMNQKYEVMLQMYGQKAEEAEEARLDLLDIKEMYKDQTNHLIMQISDLETKVASAR
ncbi:hypothetical protein SARC_04343 [Sphaeroforma arctica JP610]|uniref:TATA element modulatory factor 1 TATA binding domain-containing protein n=1 Tax=Sphaeroforma arctica JP610 TaxID=667725 RepID=A0A0L0G2N8_9EUKA|nr:hypothetical protein SARC_04343 [Sphaeroforma arctica JP610]KNC83402.1 hypothetical protein SARC_04343 [Sphaeroforma arctica JP610]|eukprot:XP_014157304.1 hypothetical protein SARC_04343 [Sphaeroforma arctica JP610]